MSDVQMHLKSRSDSRECKSSDWFCPVCEGRGGQRRPDAFLQRRRRVPKTRYTRAAAVERLLRTRGNRPWQGKLAHEERPPNASNCALAPALLNEPSQGSFHRQEKRTA